MATRNSTFNSNSVKAVILIGGPQKGTRFRPLSLDVPKPLFPVAGVPLLQHLIEALASIPTMKEILILGYFSTDDINPFLNEISPTYKGVRIRYLQEFTRLGTAGGLFHFRDQIKYDSPEAFIVMNGDVSGDFPLNEMLEFHRNNRENPLITMLGTEATRQQSVNYGCIVENKTNHQVVHFVEKPSTFVSTLINCGVYICSTEIFNVISQIRKGRFAQASINANVENLEAEEVIMIERDIIMPHCGKSKRVFVFQTNRMWSQVKTAASAIYANKQYLELYRRTRPERLVHPKTIVCGGDAVGHKIIGDVFIHPTAQVHPTCVIGPNVSIGKNVVISAGVRIRDSIILGDSTVQGHSLIMYTIIGWNSHIGKWARIEGTPSDPNPNKPFAKMENVPLFNGDGRLNPSITVLGCYVRVPSEVVVLNSIVLPHKELTRSFSNEIIL